MEQALLYFAIRLRVREIPDDKESVLWGGMTQDFINTDRVVLAWDFRTAHRTNEDVKLGGWRYTLARMRPPRIASSITASQQNSLSIEAESTNRLQDSVCDPDIPQYSYVHTSDHMVGEMEITHLCRWPFSELVDLSSV
jgi:hypothetical protein